ncbi:unnamed protein product [Urochloa humidicola]
MWERGGAMPGSRRLCIPLCLACQRWHWWIYRFHHSGHSTPGHLSGSCFNGKSVTDAVSNIDSHQQSCSHVQYPWRREIVEPSVVVPHIDQSPQERGAPVQFMCGRGDLVYKKRSNFFVPQSRYGTSSHQNGLDDQSNQNAARSESWSQQNQSAASERLQAQDSGNKKPPFKIEIGDGEELSKRINQELSIVQSKVLNFEDRYRKFIRPLLSSRGLLLSHDLKHGSTLFSHHQIIKIMTINPIYVSSCDIVEYEVGVHDIQEFCFFLKHMLTKRVCVVEDMDLSIGTIQPLMYDHGVLAPEDGTSDEFHKGECDASFSEKDGARLSYIIWKGKKIVYSEVFSMPNCNSSTEAEAYAAFALLSKARELKISKLLLCSDCKTVCGVLSGELSIGKQHDHRILYLMLRSMRRDFEKLIVMWKPRELMMFADHLAKASDREISLPLYPEKAMTKWAHHLRGDPVFRIERAKKAKIPKFGQLEDEVDESYGRNQDSIFYVETDEQYKFDCLLGLKEGFEPATLRVFIADFDARTDGFKSELQKIVQTRTWLRDGRYATFQDYTREDDDSDTSGKKTLEDDGADTSGKKTLEDDADTLGKKRTTLVVVFDSSTPKEVYYKDGAFHILLVTPDEKKGVIENGIPELNALTFVYFNGVRPLKENMDAGENEMSVKEEEEKKEREEKAKQETEEEANLKEQEVAKEDLALKETTDATAREELIKAKEHDKEKLCNISRALAVLASPSFVSKERQEFLSLVNKEIKLYNSMLENGVAADEEEAKKAYFAAREEPEHDAEVDAEEIVSSVLIEKVDAMLQELGKEIDVDEQIGNRLQLLDRDHDGKVAREDVAAAAAYLKATIGKEGVQELISNLSKDKEGKILVEDIVRLASQAEEHEEDEESRQ